MDSAAGHTPASPALLSMDKSDFCWTLWIALSISVSKRSTDLRSLAMAEFESSSEVIDEIWSAKQYRYLSENLKEINLSQKQQYPFVMNLGFLWRGLFYRKSEWV